MRNTLALLGLCALAGCSLVNDPGRHVGGGLDAEPPEEDAGPPPEDAGVDAGGAVDGGPGISGPVACGEIAEVVCRGYFTCCETAAAEPTPSDRSACQMSVRDVCERGGQEAIDLPVSGYDPHLAESLIAEGLALAERCDPDFFAWYRRRDGVFRAMRGTLAQGAICHEGVFASIPSVFSCAGGPEARCVRGDENVWRCQAPVERARDCSFQVECEDGDYCPLAFPRLCVPALASDEPCSSDYDCESNICGNDTPRVCIARDSTAAFCAVYEP